MDTHAESADTVTSLYALILCDTSGTGSVHIIFFVLLSHNALLS